MNESDSQMDPRHTAQALVDNFLAAAASSLNLGDVTQAELRYRDALRQADASFGHNSEAVVRVLESMAEFYGLQGRTDALATVQKRIELIAAAPATSTNPLPPAAANSSYGRLLSMSRQIEKPVTKPAPVRLPGEVRKSLQILGLSPDDFDVAQVKQAWKQAITDPGVHPDLGGQQEVAILLNNARDTVLRWLSEQEPKLLKKFERVVRHNN